MMIKDFDGGCMIGLTRDDIPGIQGILVFDEAKAIHELDLGNRTGGLLEVVLDVLLGNWRTRKPGSAKSYKVLDRLCIDEKCPRCSTTQWVCGRMRKDQDKLG